MCDLAVFSHVTLDMHTSWGVCVRSCRRSLLVGNECHPGAVYQCCLLGFFAAWFGSHQAAEFASSSAQVLFVLECAGDELWACALWIGGWLG